MLVAQRFAKNRDKAFFAAVLITLLSAPRVAICQQGIGDPRAAGPRVPVGLSEAVSEAIANNPGLKEQRLNWLIRQSQERAAWGAFEPVFAVGYAKNGTNRLNTASQKSSLLGKPEYKEDKGSLNAGLSGKVVTGASYDLGFALSETESDLITGKEFEATFGGSIQQPLLKGVTHQAALAEIRASRLDALIAFHTYRQQLISLVASVESSYWELALAQELEAAAGKMAVLATRVYEDSEVRASVGKMSPIDLSEAKARLDAATADRSQKEQAAIEAGLRLRLLVSSPRMLAAAALTATEPIAIDGWDSDEFLAGQDAAVAEALLYQPDVATKKAELEKQRILLDLRRDQRLPELTAKGSCYFQGLGGTPEESLRGLSGQDYPSWSLGIELKIPILGDIKGRSEIEEYALRKKLIQGQLESALHETEVAVRGLVLRAATTGRLRESALETSTFKQEQLSEELRRFDAGKSDTRKLMELESGLSEARASELEAHNKLRKALTDLAATSGTILKDKGLETVRAGLFILDEALLRPN